jgi:hypothetical protein
VRRHLPLVLLLAAAAGLRILALAAISPGIWFSDANGYIRAAATGGLSTIRVDGYALVVAPFWHLGSALALIAFQHLVGLGLVVVLYALLLRRGVDRWVALAAVTPAALDAYLIAIEHAVMAETIYHAALLGGIALLLWWDEPNAATALGAGLALGYAGVARSVGVPLAAVILLYLVVRRAAWRPVVAFASGWALVAGAYVLMFHAQHGEYGFTKSGGRFLYARVAPFAECTPASLPARLRPLCPDPALGLRTNDYLWGPRSPIAGLRPRDPRPGEFARRIIREQPLDYARVIVRGTLHYFEPGHRIAYNDYPIGPWQFPADPRRWGYPGYRGPIRPRSPLRGRTRAGAEPNRHVTRFAGTPALRPGASNVLHHYQKVAYTWGPLLAACLLLVIAALAARRGPWRLRADAALLAALTLVALAFPQAVSVFSYRYGFIAGLLLPPAAALAWTALRGGRATAQPEESSAAAAERPVRTAPSM